MSRRSTIHPIKLVAFAYGRLPGFEKNLRLMPTRD
jgi:hypothetical protein